MDQQGGSVGKSNCHQACGSEFNPQNPHDGKREPTPTRGPLTSTHVPWYMHPSLSHSFCYCDKHDNPKQLIEKKDLVHLTQPNNSLSSRKSGHELKAGT